MNLAQYLEKSMGSYAGFNGQIRPYVELKNARGSRIRFFPFASSTRNVTYVTLPAEGGVTNQDKTLQRAEEIFAEALKRGYKVNDIRYGG